MAQQILDSPVVRYLHELELVIKQKVGVVPEDVLADAREFLRREVDAQRNVVGNVDDGALYDHFLTTFGAPEQVAQQCEDRVDPDPAVKIGNAPNWRICCTRCGRSAPAAKAGITRIGARSAHKYVGGWCQDCGRLRWMRLERDLHRTNLCDQLGADLSGQQLRRQKHMPNLVFFGIFAIVGAVLLVIFAVMTPLIVLF